jgi:uncharacterized protein involved in outer membrane biogenesis
MKKRIALVVGSAGLLVLLVAGVAFAMIITGTNRPNNITATNREQSRARSHSGLRKVISATRAVRCSR